MHSRETAMKRREISEHAAPEPTSDDRYHASISILHWLMALGFLFRWGCGYAMTSVVAGDRR